MLQTNAKLTRVFRHYQPVFNALGNPTRQQIMFLLANNKQLSVIELAAKTSLSRPTISHHLKILSDARLVRAKQAGVRTYYAPAFETPLGMAQDFVATLEKYVNRG